MQEYNMKRGEIEDADISSKATQLEQQSNIPDQIEEAFNDYSDPLSTKPENELRPQKRSKWAQYLDEEEVVSGYTSFVL